MLKLKKLICWSKNILKVTIKFRNITPSLDSKTSLRRIKLATKRSERQRVGKGRCIQPTIAFPSIFLPERSSLKHRAIDNRRLCDNSHLMPIYISVFSWIMLTALRLFAPGNPARPSPSPLPIANLPPLRIDNNWFRISKSGSASNRCVIEGGRGGREQMHATFHRFSSSFSRTRSKATPHSPCIVSIINNFGKWKCFFSMWYYLRYCLVRSSSKKTSKLKSNRRRGRTIIEELLPRFIRLSVRSFHLTTANFRELSAKLDLGRNYNGA